MEPAVLADDFSDLDLARAFGGRGRDDKHLFVEVDRLRRRRRFCVRSRIFPDEEPVVEIVDDVEAGFLRGVAVRRNVEEIDVVADVGRRDVFLPRSVCTKTRFCSVQNASIAKAGTKRRRIRAALAINGAGQCGGHGIRRAEALCPTAQSAA